MEPVTRPVDVARLILDQGRSLKTAHAVLDRLVAGERVCMELHGADVRDLQRRFRALGIAATPLQRPAVGVSAVRHQLDLTQAEFAMRFGFEAETVRNWEQGRNNPDPAIQVLLAVIREAPDVVDRVMSPRPSTDESEPAPATRTPSSADG